MGPRKGEGEGGRRKGEGREGWEVPTG